ncbi:MAG TPA: GSCFA domain-containing protein [Bacteroidales bacterium]|nr:GSCFA domain-containing protein [Bacteroidales bacterium]
MEFRTSFDIEPSDFRIGYNTGVMFLGSCFASSIGEQMNIRKMPVLINPYGTIYNPESVRTAIEAVISGKEYSVNDLFNYKGTWLSFSHYTDFSSEDAGLLLERINNNRKGAEEFLRKASCLFITFGTARIYRLKDTGKPVSNCHKVPASYFTNELLSVEAITESWSRIIKMLGEFNPELRIIFTVSPVRHWKDGAHGNQISKSILLLAIDRIREYFPSIKYFPAYELMLDDLRDYRFFNDDMLHPSEKAIEYIWEKFSGTYFDKSTTELQARVLRITKALNHRFITGSENGRREFAANILKQISDLEKHHSYIDLTRERKYFSSLSD